jgi:hypothetical protein
MVMTLSGRTIHRAIATAAGIGVLIAIPSAIGFAIIGLRETGLPWGSLGFVNLPPWRSPACRSFRPPMVWPPRTACPLAPAQDLRHLSVVVSAIMFKNAMKMM